MLERIILITIPREMNPNAKEGRIRCAIESANIAQFLVSNVSTTINPVIWVIGYSNDKAVSTWLFEGR